jgi:hypothetical protein
VNTRMVLIREKISSCSHRTNCPDRRITLVPCKAQASIAFFSSIWWRPKLPARAIRQQFLCGHFHDSYSLARRSRQRGLFQAA